MTDNKDIDDLPQDVKENLENIRDAFAADYSEIEKLDPNYNGVVNHLAELQVRLDEQRKGADGYFFNVDEFKDALEHVVADQLSAIAKERITMQEFGARLNRWFVFCDAVVNLGVYCPLDKEALAAKDFEKVFKKIKLNKQFEETFLKKHKIQIEFAYKTGSLKKEYKWLAMPVLVIKDAEGKRHEIAITPSPVGSIWWLELLSEFHGSYQWKSEQEVEQQDFDEAPYTLYGDTEPPTIH